MLAHHSVTALPGYSARWLCQSLCLALSGVAYTAGMAKIPAHGITRNHACSIQLPPVLGQRISHTVCGGDHVAHGALAVTGATGTNSCRGGESVAAFCAKQRAHVLQKARQPYAASGTRCSAVPHSALPERSAVLLPHIAVLGSCWQSAQLLPGRPEPNSVHAGLLYIGACAAPRPCPACRCLHICVEDCIGGE